MAADDPEGGIAYDVSVPVTVDFEFGGGGGDPPIFNEPDDEWTPGRPQTTYYIPDDRGVLFDEAYEDKFNMDIDTYDDIEQKFRVRGTWKSWEELAKREKAKVKQMSRAMSRYNKMIRRASINAAKEIKAEEKLLQHAATRFSSMMNRVDIDRRKSITADEKAERKWLAKLARIDRENLTAMQGAASMITRFENEILDEQLLAEEMRRRPAGPPMDIARPPAETRGGIFGSDVDLYASVTFQKAKQIRGGLPVAVGGAGLVRDRTSRSPFPDTETWTEKSRRFEDMFESFMALNGQIRGGVLDFATFLNSPERVVGQQLIRILSGAGPYGAAAAAAITAIIVLPEVAEKLIQALSQKGFWLNDDWRRTIETEVDPLFDIDEKKRRLMGHDAYIITQTDGYVPDTGATVYNSYENRMQLRVSESIGLAEKAVGLRGG